MSISVWCVLLAFVSVPLNEIAAQPPVKKTFGQRQLELLLIDRPDMRDIIEAHRDIKELLIEGFEPTASQRIYWDHRDTVAPLAAHMNPERFPYPSMVRVSARAEHTPEAKLGKLLFVLTQIRLLGIDPELMKQAQSGQITREEYIDRMMERDFKALQKTKRCLKANGFLLRSAPILGGLGDLERMPEDVAEFRKPAKAAASNFWRSRNDYEQLYETAMAVKPSPVRMGTPAGRTIFGQQQVQLLLMDRPELKEIVNANEGIEEWLVEHFAPSTEQRFYWDFREPSEGRPTEIRPGTVLMIQDAYPGMVRLLSDQAFPPADKLVVLVRGLAILNCSPTDWNASEKARKGELSRDDFVRTMLRIDFCADRKVKKLVEASPHLGENLHDPKKLEYILGVPEDFEIYLERYAAFAGGVDLRKFYGDYYDQMRAQGTTDNR